MDQKVKDLAKKAGFVMWDNEPCGPGPYDEELEKFYELVVRACAKEVKNVYKQGGGTYAEAILSKFNLKVTE